ncbi:MAG TPA: CVNH domain-containing protein [Alphaproteobacteria bacterium]|nr:CVNH domain-containing protein [Alphaproteobacteria bacterium]
MDSTACGLLAGAALLILAVATPARAQGFPDGSYVETCRNMEMHGDTLVADCLRRDGQWARSGLDLDRCRGGDIANLDGQLACRRRGHHRDDDDRRYDDDRRGPYDR